MADQEDQEGPVFVWTFPLISRLQSGDIVDFGQSSSVETVTSKVSDGIDKAKESGPVRDTVSNTLGSSDEDEVHDLENELEQMEDDSDNIFNDYGQEDSVLDIDNNVVEVEDGTFVPLRMNIEEGESVTWVNNTEDVHRVVSTSGEEFSSEQLGPEEEFTHTFDETGVTKFIDGIEGGDQMCGAVIVGEAELDEVLRCEEDVDRQLFIDDEDDGTRTMSAAVEDKEDMDVGF